MAASSDVEEMLVQEQISPEQSSRTGRAVVHTRWVLAATLVAFGLVAVLTVSKTAAPDAAIGVPLHGSVEELSSLSASNGHADDPCGTYPHLKLESVHHNNLGGKGPDGGTENLQYYGHWWDPTPPHSQQHPLNIPVRVHVSALTAYELPAGKENGLNGQFAKIWLNPGADVQLHVKVFPRDSHDHLHHRESYLTFFGLDKSASADECVESVWAVGSDQTLTSPASELKYHTEGPYSVVEATKGSATQAIPSQPYHLTEDQYNQAASFRFPPQPSSTWTYDFRLKVSDGSDGPREIGFTGRPAMSCLAHSRHSMNCPEWDHTLLHRVTQNNLGGKGPDQGPEYLEYSGWAYINRTETRVRVRVRVADGETYDRPSNTVNGLSGEFAKIWVNPGETVNLVAEYLDESGKPLGGELAKEIRKESPITFFGIGTDINGKNEMTAGVQDPKDFFLSDPTGLFGVKENDWDLIKGLEYTGDKPVPADPYLLSLHQMQEAVTFRMTEKTEFHMRLEVGGDSFRAKAGPASTDPSLFTFAFRPTLPCKLGTLPGQNILRIDG